MSVIQQYFQIQKRQKVPKSGKNVTLRMSDGTEINTQIEYKKEQEDRKYNDNI